MMILNRPKPEPELGPFNGRGTRDRAPRGLVSRAILASNSQGNLRKIALPFLASAVE